jgi:leucine dehydrogenase
MTTETFRESEKRGHEQVVFFNYPKVGLKAIVAIHSTALGPSLGGCRMRLYESESKALEDVMRLSEGMSYKNAVAGLELGGGKSCIIADPAMKEGREALFRRFAECIKSLSGRYYTAEDMGTSVADIMLVKQICPYVSGTALENGGGGDPSPWTARGVFQGILAVSERRFGSKDLKGKHVTIQGVGHVGEDLAVRLIKAGAKVTVCDVVKNQAEKVAKEIGANVVAAEAIYDVDCDIYAPCAIGQTVNADTIKRLKCSVIAGAANNQLSDESLYAELEKRQIIYCPDFVINAGGVINCASECRKEGWSESWTAAKVDKIYDTIHLVLDKAEKQNRPTEVVALEIARERIKNAQN